MTIKTNASDVRSGDVIISLSGRRLTVDKVESFAYGLFEIHCHDVDGDRFLLTDDVVEVVSDVCSHRWKRLPGTPPKGHLPPRQCELCGHVDSSRKAGY